MTRQIHRLGIRTRREEHVIEQILDPQEFNLQTVHTGIQQIENDTICGYVVAVIIERILKGEGFNTFSNEVTRRAMREQAIALEPHMMPGSLIEPISDQTRDVTVTLDQYVQSLSREILVTDWNPDTGEDFMEAGDDEWIGEEEKTKEEATSPLLG